MKKRSKRRRKVSTGNSGKNSGTRKRGRIENLTPWKPGQSGNPEGRPRYALARDAFRAILALPIPNDPAGRTFAEGIGEMLAKRALDGDLNAIQLLLERAEGNPIASGRLNSSLGSSPFDDDLSLTVFTGDKPAEPLPFGFVDRKKDQPAAVLPPSGNGHGNGASGKGSRENRTERNRPAHRSRHPGVAPKQVSLETKLASLSTEIAVLKGITGLMASAVQAKASRSATALLDVQQRHATYATAQQILGVAMSSSFRSARLSVSGLRVSSGPDTDAARMYGRYAVSPVRIAAPGPCTRRIARTIESGGCG